MWPLSGDIKILYTEVEPKNFNKTCASLQDMPTKDDNMKVLQTNHSLHTIVHVFPTSVWVIYTLYLEEWQQARLVL